MSADPLPTRSNAEAQSTPEARTTGPSGFVPLADGATSDAESLLRLLKDAARPTPPPSAPALPAIPGYELLGELGRGGMGVVYKARECNLNRFVALKMILTPGQLPPGEVARFRAEAEAVAAIDHPNVVRVFELCPPDCARPYFAMEYVEGGSLAKLLKERERLPAREAAALLAPVADGLQAAHDAGIVHRDVKPGNILLSGGPARGAEPDAAAKGPPPASHSGLRHSRAAPQPKVSDFGLAKRLTSDATVTQGAVRGTPAYMAPEQAGAKSRFVGPQADVYALGAVLYECLTGSPPFVGLDAWDVVHSVLNERPHSPRAAEPTVPRDLELICLKCLEKEPRDRYQTAAELGDDLRAFLDGRPVAARPIGAAARAARWARRHPARAALVALTALLLVVVPPLVVFAAERYETKGAEAETAREREKAARAAADLAILAQAREEDARRAALRLADARELFALQGVFRARADTRPLRWAAATRADAARAVGLAGDDPAAVADLRSAAAAALLAPDLAPLDSALVGYTGGVLATDPRTGRVAVGELVGWVLTPLHVWVLDPGTGKVARTLTFTADLVPDPKVGGLKGSPDGVRALAFSPDGARLFVGTRSGRVIRFDLDAGGVQGCEWKAASAPVQQLAVAADGQTVYGLCPPQRPVFAWHADTGRELARLDNPGHPAWSFALLAGGAVLTADAAELRTWGADHRLARAVPNPGAGRLAVAPGGLVVGNGPNLDLYDPTDLVPTDRFSTRELRRGVHEQYLRFLAVHPSGAFVATASGDQDRTVRVWDLASLRRVGTVTVRGTGPMALAWSGDGRTLLATGNGHVARWAFSAPEAERCACFAPVPLEAAGFTGGGRVAAASAPAGARRDLLSGPPGGAAVAAAVPLGGEVPGLAHTPDRPLVVTARAGAARWEPGPKPPDRPFFAGPARCPRFAPDGKTVWLIADGVEVRSFAADTARPLTAWKNEADKTAHGLPGLDALAVGAATVATGGVSGSVHLLDPRTGQRLDTFPRAGDPVLALALTPGEDLVVAAAQSGKVRLIRTADRKELPPFAAHLGDATALAVSPDGGLLATGGRDQAVRFWRRAGERFELLFAVPDLSGPVKELQFHPQGDRLLVLVGQERAARVWDVAHLKRQLGALKLGL